MGKITLLGVKGGPAIRKGGAMPTASLLQFGGQTILIDCGIGVTRSVVETGVNLTEIDAIFITHLHSDHVLELGPLLYTAWTTGLTRSIKVFGPEGIEDHLDHFLMSMSYDHDIRLADEGRSPIRDLIDLVPFSEGPLEDLGNLHVTSLRVDHPPVTDCFALKFTHNGKSAVFSADTCYFPPLAEFARGAAVLVHEAMLTSGVDWLVDRTPGAARLRDHLMASHTPACDVGRVASAAMVGHLVLNHLVPIDCPGISDSDWIAEVSQYWNGPVSVGQDGMVVSF